MHVLFMPHLLLAAMPRTVVGDPFFHAARGPRLVRVHLRTPIGFGFWVNAGHDSYPPVAPLRTHAAEGKGSRRSANPAASASVVGAHRAPQRSRPLDCRQILPTEIVICDVTLPSSYRDRVITRRSLARTNSMDSLSFFIAEP